MPRAATPPLPVLLALVLLTACGGSGLGDVGETGAGAVYAVTPPHRPEDVAIAIRPDGEIVTRKGLTEKDREAGREFPSRETSGYQATHARVVADGTQPWLRVHSALNPVVGPGTTLVDLEIHEPGLPGRTVSFATSVKSPTRPVGRTLLRLVFGLEAGALTVRAGISDGPWLRRHGCGAADDRTWPWAEGRALASLDALLADLRTDAPATLDVRIEVPGIRWLHPVPKGEAPPTRPSVTVVADVLDLLLDHGISQPDLALLPRGGFRRRQGLVEKGLAWLAAHQSPDGRWDADDFLHWCHGRPMAAVDGGDGAAHFDVGATGMALLAFLGAGYTNRGRHPFASTVAKGLKWLKAQGPGDGACVPPGTPERALGHALGTAALLQAYAMTESPIWKARTASALEALPAVLAEGPGDAVATAIAAFVVQSVRQTNEHAEKRGRPRPFAVDPAFVARLHGSCRTLARSRHSREAAAGIVGCLLLGDDPQDRVWIDAVTAAATADPVDPDPWATWLYFVAAWRMKSPTWKTWTPVVKARLPIGLFLMRGEEHYCCFDGSWAVPEGLRLSGGRVEATVLALFAGQLYYRYDRALR